jgi:hypothetical protein
MFSFSRVHVSTTAKRMKTDAAITKALSSLDQDPVMSPSFLLMRQQEAEERRLDRQEAKQ